MVEIQPLSPIKITRPQYICCRSTIDIEPRAFVLLPLSYPSPLLEPVDGHLGVVQLPVLAFPVQTPMVPSIIERKEKGGDYKELKIIQNANILLKREENLCLKKRVLIDSFEFSTAIF